MADRTLELALRLRADLDQARRALDELESKVKGVGDAAAETNRDLANQRNRLNSTTEAMKRAGITAGEYKQAMRMLPAQITDITTSLASGMPVWMVAIQQGGQIRDSFGGIGNAARALVSTINPVTAGLAGVAGAVLGLVAAYEAGASEQRRFNEALILTGNYAGVTAGQLAAMSRGLDALEGITQSSAADALVEVASRGKFTSEQILLIATAAEQMRVAIGREVSETVDEFVKLADSPVEAILKLNETQHFLTEAQLEQIRTLQEQQGEQAAATEAMRVYGAVIAERTPQINQNLGLIERAWRDIKQVASETIDGLLAIGRPLDDLQQVEQLTQRIAYLRSTLGTGFEPLADTQGEIDRLTKQLDALTAKQEAAANAAKATVDSTAELAKQAAAESFVKSAEAQLQSLQKLTNVQRAHLVMQEKGISETSVLGKRMLEAAEAADKQKAAVEAQAKAEREAEEARRRSKREAEAAVREAERLASQQLSYVQGLEKQAATLSMTTAEVRQYELAERGLTGVLLERAQAALALLEAEEKARQAQANARTNAGLEAEYLRAIGRETDAALLEIRTKFEAMRAEFEKAGNVAGLAWIEKLIPVAEAKARVDEVQREVDRILEEQRRQESSVNVQQDAGLLTELQARERLLEIHRQTYDKLQQIRPVLEELARQPGAVGEAAARSLAALDDQAQRLLTTTSLLAETLRDGLTTGITESLSGLAKGTMDLEEAITALANSVIDALVRMAAEDLAVSATNGLMGLVGGGPNDASLTAGAAAVTASAAELTTAGGTLITGAAAIQSAAAALAMANGVEGVSAAGAGGSGLWTSIKGLFGFASGGLVLGPGTPTSDSIPAWLSNHEFVTRAAVVMQPGALDFLQDFNARGMAALDDWTGRVRHATGGLAGVPAPALPSPGLATAQLADPAGNRAGTVVENGVDVFIGMSDDFIAERAWTKAGRARFYAELEQNAATVRQLLRIN